MSTEVKYTNIPSLPVHTPPLSGEELMIIVQGGIDRHLSLSDLREYFSTNEEGLDLQTQVDTLTKQVGLINQKLILFFQEEPTAADKSFTYKDQTYDFQVGQVVIYNDQTNNRLAYYAFRGLSGEDAVWQLLNPIIEMPEIPEVNLDKVSGKLDVATSVIPATHANVLMSLSSDSTISCTGFDDGQNVQVLIINTSSATINLTIPATGDYILLGYSANRVVAMQANEEMELSVWFINGKYRLKIME